MRFLEYIEDKKGETHDLVIEYMDIGSLREVSVTSVAQLPFPGVDLL